MEKRVKKSYGDKCKSIGIQNRESQITILIIVSTRERTELLHNQKTVT